MKKIILILLLLITITGCNSKNNPDEVDINYNKLKETRVIDNIEISNLNIKIMDGVSEINYKIKNKDITDKKINEIEMIFKNKKGEEITTFTVNVDNTLKYNEEKTITNVIDVDLTKASKYEVIVK